MGRRSVRPGSACKTKKGASGKINKWGTCRKTRKDAGRSRGEGTLARVDGKGREVYLSPRGAYYHFSKSGRSKVYHKVDKVY